MRLYDIIKLNISFYSNKCWPFGNKIISYINYMQIYGYFVVLLLNKRENRKYSLINNE